MFMRNNIITFVGLLLMVLTGLSSCEKMVIEEDDNGGQPAVESNANLILKIVADETRGDISDYWKTLNFVVYQGDKKVKAVTQKAGESDYGKVGMTLAQGTYQVMVLAHSSANPTLSNPENVKFTNDDGFSDTFTGYNASVEVGDQPKTYEIRLTRATSMLRFKTKDVKPARVTRLWFQYRGGSRAVNVLTGYGVDASIQTVVVDVPDSLTGKSLTFDFYTFLREDEGTLSLSIKAFDSKGSLLLFPGMDEKEYIREFKDIPMKRNEITEYSGNFFEGVPADDARADSTASSFTIIADTAWAGITHYDF